MAKRPTLHLERCSVRGLPGVANADARTIGTDAGWHYFRGAIRSAIAPYLRPRTRPEEISALTACADAVQMTARTLPDQLARRATIKRLSVNPADDIRITGTRDSKLISGFALAVSRR
jgi:hypothetical protein